jgi:hypothetical protein
MPRQILATPDQEEQVRQLLHKNPKITYRQIIAAVNATANCAEDKLTDRKLRNIINRLHLYRGHKRPPAQIRKEEQEEQETKTRHGLPPFPALPYALPMKHPKTCQFITGSGRNAKFCCEPAVHGKSYCEVHSAICYTGTRPMSVPHTGAY